MTMLEKARSFRPSTNRRSKSYSSSLLSSPFQRGGGGGESRTFVVEDDDTSSRLSISRGKSMPEIGGKNGSKAEAGVDVHHDLSFQDAKKIWLREWKKTIEETADDNKYQSSHFKDDIKKLATLQHDDDTTNTRSHSAGSIDLKSIGEEPMKQLRFSDITIREYPIIPGDTPACSGGPPMTIGWEYLHPSITLDIDDYEQYRTDNQRRQICEMRIPATHRQLMLKRLGFTIKEITESIKIANICRRQRVTTNGLEYMDKTHLHIESAIRKIHNIVTFGRKKRLEKNYLKQTIHV